MPKIDESKKRKVIDEQSEPTISSSSKKAKVEVRVMFKCKISGFLYFTSWLMRDSERRARNTLDINYALPHRFL